MRYLLILSLVLVTLFSVVSPVSALTISPVKVEISGNPGQTLAGEIELINEQKEAKTFFPSYENFEPNGDTGSPYFVGGGSDLATWIRTQEEIMLLPGEKKVIPYTISIPADAEAGGYFAAIFLGENDTRTQEGGEVSVGGRLGVLILLRVNGDIPEQAGIVSFESSQGRFLSQLPIQFLYRVNNTGGDRIVPLGELTVRNTFGGTSVKLDANAKEGSVLPNSTRRFDAEWQEGTAPVSGFFASARSQLSHFHFGWYRANLDLTWGTENQKGAATYHFFIIPWQLLSVALFLLVFGYFALRKYNSWIVAKSAQRT